MRKLLLATVAVLGFGSFVAHADTDLITNGNFGTGDFTGWTANVQPGSSGGFSVLSGTTAPISGFSTAGPAAGSSFYALTDQSGPGSYSLTQSFVVAPGTTDVTVSFALFANSYGGNFSTNPNRDFTVFPNENAEVDILTGSANPFTVSPSDIVTTLYGPGTDNPDSNPNPWTTYTDDLGALGAGTYQIRFAETDNQNFFNLGVDNVSVDATATSVPEPLSVALLGTGLVGFVASRRRKAK